MLAARRGKRLVAAQEFDDARDKVLMGAERRSMVMTDDEKRMTAYHEAGHALVFAHEPTADPIHKATIIPRGFALGMVSRCRNGTAIPITATRCTPTSPLAFGGRIAEELIFGYDKVSSGASNDIMQATRLARAMVTKWGLSDEVGPLNFSENDESTAMRRARQADVGRDGAADRHGSEALRRARPRPCPPATHRSHRPAPANAQALPNMRRSPARRSTG